MRSAGGLCGPRTPRHAGYPFRVLEPFDAEIAGFVSPSTFPWFGVPLNLDV